MFRFAHLLLATLLVPSAALPAADGNACGPRIAFADRTRALGLEKRSPTFAAAFTDIDGDQDDDLVVVNHGASPPSLYLNEGGRFVDRSELLPATSGRDRHGVSVIDLDGDGDREVVVAGGGGGREELGNAVPNELYENLMADGGELAFADRSEASGLGFLAWRGRHFLALARGGGKRVDLLFLARARSGLPSLYLRNQGGLRFARAALRGFGGEQASEGHDLAADLDRDGRADLVLIRQGRPRLLAGTARGFRARRSALDRIGRVAVATAADLDRDGLPEIILGVTAPESANDRLVADEGEIHFVTFDHPRDARDGFSFATGGSSIEIDLLGRNGIDPDDPSDIFLGAGRQNPASRVAVVDERQAGGAPEIHRPGIYIWFDATAGRWSVEMRYGPEAAGQAGLVRGAAIRDLEGRELETFPEESTRDRIFVNRGGFEFEEIAVAGLQHDDSTRSVAAVDLDNNGWTDLVLLRGSGNGEPNGMSVVLANCGGLVFRKTRLPNRDARIFQAGEVVAGFADDDGRPDLFLTNGYGQPPSNGGPYRLLQNVTRGSAGFLTLELVGPGLNRDAIGAQVEFVDRAGRLLGYRMLAYRGRAQDSHRLHLGLGGYRGPVFAEIRWPDGKRERSGPLRRDRHHAVARP